MAPGMELLHLHPFGTAPGGASDGAAVSNRALLLVLLDEQLIIGFSVTALFSCLGMRRRGCICRAA